MDAAEALFACGGEDAQCAVGQHFESAPEPSGAGWTVWWLLKMVLWSMIGLIGLIILVVLDVLAAMAFVRVTKRRALGAAAALATAEGAEQRAT